MDIEDAGLRFRLLLQRADVCGLSGRRAEQFADRLSDHQLVRVGLCVLADDD